MLIEMRHTIIRIFIPFIRIAGFRYPVAETEFNTKNGDALLNQLLTYFETNYHTNLQ